MEQFIDLESKLVLIAGASSGIGRATAVKLSKYGAKCVLIARREDKLRETLELLDGGGHAYYAADLSMTEEISDLVKRICGETGAFDGMVYCAGIGTSRPLRMTSPSVMQETMNINFFAFYELVRAISAKKHCHEGMHIVGISSIAAIQGEKAQSAYSASKAAMDAAARVLAQELAAKKITVNTIRPGMTRTEMYDGFLKICDESLLQKQFLGIAETEDIANMIAFLLSPAARFITGANINIDGGYTCH